MSRFGYVYANSDDPNPRAMFEGYALDRLFIDHASTQRSSLEELFEYARENDIIIIYSVDCLARNLDELCGRVLAFMKKGVQVQFIKEDFSLEVLMALLAQSNV